jgi:hypothetical protein
MAVLLKEFLRQGSLGQAHDATVLVNMSPLIRREKSALSSSLLERPGTGRVFDGSSGMGDFF